MLELKSARVLVTGARGFVGSHLVERLAAEGCRVRCFDRASAGEGLLRHLPDTARRGLEVVVGDLRDEAAVRRAAQGMDVICHLGALTSVPYALEHPREVMETNLMGTVNVLVAARDLGVGRVVVVSSGDVYGTARYLPLDEGHPLQSRSPYAASKIGAEKAAESFHAAYGLPVVILRPFNAYGPRQSARAVIPSIIAQALAGPTVRLGATWPTRDFTYVADTVEALLLAARCEAAPGRIFNIGSGTEIAIGDLARMIITLLGRDVTIISEEAERLRPAASEAQRVRADNTLARQVLGWKPRVPLEEGLRRTIDWIAAHLEDYRQSES